MQPFKPDCTIYVALHSHGKPAKYGYAVRLVDAKGLEIFTAAKFIGIGQRVEMELAAIRLGLGQAFRLRQEKIELRLGPGVSADFLRDDRSLPREEKLKLQYMGAQEEFQQFRLRRILQVPREQLHGADILAEKASHGIREIGDLR